MSKLESEIQSDLIRLYESQGYYVVKVMACNKNGFHDLIRFKDGIAETVEVKRPGEAPSHLQLKRKQELNAHGIRCLLVTEGGEELEWPEMTTHPNLKF